MATQILDNAHLSVDGNDLSSYIRQVTFNYEAESQDETAMGNDTRKNKGGLKNWSIEVEFNQDFGSSGLDSNLFGLVGSQVPIVLRPDAGSVSTSNPEFTGTGLVASYPPIGGNAVGDVATTSATIQSAGTLSRATS